MFKKILIQNIEKILKGYENSFFEKSIKLNFTSILRPGFWITENIGNNSFSFNTGKKIFVAPIIEGSQKDIEIGENIVFTDLTDKKKESSVGLKYFVCGYSKKSKTPIFICDNHNYVLEVWELLKNKKLPLVHIDQHKDNQIFTENEQDWRKTTKICNYINFAQKRGWINEVISFTESSDLKQLSFIKPEKCILNIDLDLFHPDCSLISLEEKLNIIYNYLPKAELITIATSPLFIDQNLAVKLAKLFWQYL